jgi:ectoine hydroxylase-related dioxygenase (phytanoyl-CoA dioxygenase family)
MGLACRWFHLYQRACSLPQAWFNLRGNASQLDARQPFTDLGAEQHRLSVVDPTIAALRRLLQEHGIDASHLCVAALKLLRSAPGLGLQPVHFDVPRYKDAVQCYSVLMYCTETMTTAVPKLDAATMRPLFTDGEELSAKQHALAEKLCAEENFISFPVQAGATLVFSAATPHYGVRNIASTDRVVLYALFSPSEEPGQDDTQRFPLGVTDD